MIHSLAAILFRLMVLLSQHLCLTVDPLEEFILNWCSSLCWHWLYLCCLSHLSNNVHLCFASDTFIRLSLNLFKNLANCSMAAPPNNALNIKAELKEGFQHRLVMFTEFSCRNYQRTKFLGQKKYLCNHLFLVLDAGGKSHIVPKLANAQVKCPRLAYGNKAFNLQAAAANWHVWWEFP